MVSSDTLFTAVVEGDISSYRGQCIFNMWLLGAEATELYLHVWDIPELSRLIVIERDESEIQQLEDDMVEFDRLVSGYEAKLLKAMGRAPAPTVPPWAEAPAPAATTKAAEVAMPDF